MIFFNFNFFLYIPLIYDVLCIYMFKYIIRIINKYIIFIPKLPRFLPHRFHLPKEPGGVEDASEGLANQFGHFRQPGF